MSFWDSFWNIFWMFFWTFALVAYLIVLFRIVVDLFQDTSLSGGWKALWVVCLFFLPFLTALVYLVARGRAMAARQALQAKMARESTESYIRSVSGGPSPADEIAKAKALLEAGTISESEFTALKYRHSPATGLLSPPQDRTATAAGPDPRLNRVPAAALEEEERHWSV